MGKDCDAVRPGPTELGWDRRDGVARGGRGDTVWDGLQLVGQEGRRRGAGAGVGLTEARFLARTCAIFPAALIEIVRHQTVRSQMHLGASNPIVAPLHKTISIMAISITNLALPWCRRRLAEVLYALTAHSRLRRFARSHVGQLSLEAVQVSKCCLYRPYCSLTAYGIKTAGLLQCSYRFAQLLLEGPVLGAR